MFFFPPDICSKSSFQLCRRSAVCISTAEFAQLGRMLAWVALLPKLCLIVPLSCLMACVDLVVHVLVLFDQGGRQCIAPRQKGGTKR